MVERVGGSFAKIKKLCSGERGNFWWRKYLMNAK